jgi:hypothetical protein
MVVEAPIRNTLTLDPAGMEADRTSAVYRVSHVDDGAFVFLLRRHHVKHYDFATAAPLRRAPSSRFHQPVAHF